MKQILATIIIVVLLSSCNSKTNEPAKEMAVTPTVSSSDSSKMKPSEIADSKYSEIGKRFLSSFSNGNVEAWMNNWTDNAVFTFSNRDSIVGKAAITKYWKDRLAELESISFSNEIWLPIQVNKPQALEEPGTWLLGWYLFDEKFKNGKSVTEWAHDDIHFNSEGNIDRQVHYVDMAPINAAMGK